jgi:seryl-tRNA synthetase
MKNKKNIISYNEHIDNTTLVDKVFNTIKNSNEYSEVMKIREGIESLLNRLDTRSSLNDKLDELESERLTRKEYYDKYYQIIEDDGKFIDEKLKEIHPEMIKLDKELKRIKESLLNLISPIVKDAENSNKIIDNIFKFPIDSVTHANTYKLDLIIYTCDHYMRSTPLIMLPNNENLKYAINNAIK